MADAERARIAADLHDRAIQKVFAAGLQLQGMVPDLPDEVRRQVAEVMGELDGAAASYRDALRLEPGFAPARGNLARVDSVRTARAR